MQFFFAKSRNLWKHRAIGEGITGKAVKRLGLLLFLGLAFVVQAPAQNKWNNEEIGDIFDGIYIDVSPAMWEIEAKGVTPFDFGRQLLRDGEGEKAKEWFTTLTIANKDHAAAFGLAWVQWQTGNDYGALIDSYNLLQKEPGALILARVFYLIGSVSLENGDLETAHAYLTDSFNEYAALGKDGGLFLALTGLARLAIAENDFERVEPLLELAYQHNDKVTDKGGLTYSRGRYHEIIAEMEHAQGNEPGATWAMTESEWAYRDDLETGLADIILASTTGGMPGDDTGSLVATGGQPPRDDGGATAATTGPGPRDDKDSKATGGEAPRDDGDSAQASEGEEPSDDKGSAAKTGGQGSADEKDSLKATGGEGPTDEGNAFSGPRDDKGSQSKNTTGPDPADDKDSLKITVGPSPGDESDS